MMDKESWEDGFLEGVKFVLSAQNTFIREKARQHILDMRM